MNFCKDSYKKGQVFNRTNRLYTCSVMHKDEAKI